MAQQAEETTEVLVIPGEGGKQYAIPRDVLEQFEIPEGAHESLEAGRVPDDEVAGYWWQQNWWSRGNYSNIINQNNANVISQNSGTFRGGYWRG